MFSAKLKQNVEQNRSVGLWDFQVQQLCTCPEKILFQFFRKAGRVRDGGTGTRGKIIWSFTGLDLLKHRLDTIWLPVLQNRKVGFFLQFRYFFFENISRFFFSKEKDFSYENGLFLSYTSKYISSVISIFELNFNFARNFNSLKFRFFSQNFNS